MSEGQIIDKYILNVCRNVFCITLKYRKTKVTAREKKTALRTIRLTRELDGLLQKDAENTGISVNALVYKIMTKYAEWDRYIEKFGFVSIANTTFKSILDEVDDKRLENIAQDLGRKMPKAVTLFWFKKLDLDTFLKTLSLFEKYSGLQRMEVDFAERNCCVLTFHHNLGNKWSVFMEHFFGQAVKVVFGTLPKSEIAENLVVLTFRIQ